MPRDPDEVIRNVLRSTKTIAMIGASSNDMRPSYFAMKYLLDKGFVVRPVNPALAASEILGQKVYASLREVPPPVDMVEIFRASDAVPGIVAEALTERERLGLKTIWMQLSVINEDAAALARGAGLTVIMDRCPKIEYGRMSGEISWMGVNRRLIDNRKPLLFSRGGALKR